MDRLVGAGRFFAPFAIMAVAAFYVGLFPFQQEKPENAELAAAQKELETAKAKLQKAQERVAELAKDEKSSDVEQAVLVETVRAEKWTKSFTIETEGEAVRWRILTIPAEVAGRIQKKHDACRGGSYVKAGTPLFEIDPTNYRLEVQKLTAQLQQSEADLQSIDVDEENAEKLLALADEDLKLQARQLKRFESGFNRDAVTENDLEQIQRQELAARNSLQTQKNQLRSLAQKRKTLQAGLALVKAQLDRAKKDLERTQISSPIPASVIDDIAEEGNYVKPGDPLVHLSDTSQMEVKFSLQAEELAWVWLVGNPGNSSADEPADPLKARFEIPELPCDVVYELQGGRAIWKARLSRYEGVGVDPDTRTIACRAFVPNPRDVDIETYGDLPPGVNLPSLMSGLFVTVRIPLKSPAPILAVPTQAVRPGGQVWINRDNKLEILEASVAHVEDGQALLVQRYTKLRAGDRVIVSPLVAVRDGMTLKEMGDRKEADDDDDGEQPQTTETARADNAQESNK